MCRTWPHISDKSFNHFFAVSHFTFCLRILGFNSLFLFLYFRARVFTLQLGFYGGHFTATRIYHNPTSKGLLLHYQSHMDHRNKTSFLRTLLSRTCCCSASCSCSQANVYMFLRNSDIPRYSSILQYQSF